MKKPAMDINRPMAVGFMVGQIIDNTGLTLNAQIKINELTAMNRIRQVETKWYVMTSDGYAGEKMEAHEPKCSVSVAGDNECDFSWKDREPTLAPVIKTPNIYEIIETVSKCTGVPVKLMCSPSRRSSVVRARWVAMYMARMKTHATLEEIGIAFNREHSSVIHGINIVKKDQALIDCVRRIQAEMCWTE